jgi:hypothetical protein
MCQTLDMVNILSFLMVLIQFNFNLFKLESARSDDRDCAVYAMLDTACRPLYKMGLLKY